MTFLGLYFCVGEFESACFLRRSLSFLMITFRKLFKVSFLGTYPNFRGLKLVRIVTEFQKKFAATESKKIPASVHYGSFDFVL